MRVVFESTAPSNARICEVMFDHYCVWNHVSRIYENLVLIENKVSLFSSSFWDLFQTENSKFGRIVGRKSLAGLFRPAPAGCLYRVFRDLWHPLRELIVRLKIMKKSHTNNVCLRLRDVMNFINRANSSKPVWPGVVYSIFAIIIIGTKKTHVLLCIRDINASLV